MRIFKEMRGKCLHKTVWHAVTLWYEQYDVEKRSLKPEKAYL